MSNLAKTAFVLALSTAALSAVSAPASALVVANGAFTDNFLFGPPEAFVPINGTSTILRFTLPAPAKVAITFSAECTVGDPTGDTLNSYVDIDILVDGGAPVPPTAGNTDAFCTTPVHGAADVRSFIRPSVTVVKSLSAGSHFVNVLGRHNGPSTFGWLSNSSTVIER